MIDNKDQYLEKSVMSGYEFLTGDINFSQYGGKWIKQIDDTIYHVIELINMWDATGEENQPQYNVNLQEIDLSTANYKDALECCEVEFTSDGLHPYVIVDCISSYGQYAPMGNWDGNNYRKLLKLAKQESKEISNNEYYHYKQLARPVNKIGSTAREYASGDTTSALIRGIANNDKAALLLGKINGITSDLMQEIQSNPDNKQFNLWEE